MPACGRLSLGLRTACLPGWHLGHVPAPVFSEKPRETSVAVQAWLCDSCRIRLSQLSQAMGCDKPAPQAVRDQASGNLAGMPVFPGIYPYLLGFKRCLAQRLR